MTSEITYDFKAIISLFTTQMGGRRKPIYSGYRPSFAFNTQKHFCGEISLLQTDELKPGNSAEVFIKLLPSQYIRQNLKPGDAFSILEGNTPIGSGIIETIEKVQKEYH